MNTTAQSSDDLASVYPPANNHDRTLLCHATLAQERLLRAYDLESKVLAETGLIDLFTKKPDQFKHLARHIAECERIYRRAIEALERAQRARARAARATTAPPLPAPEIHLDNQAAAASTPATLPHSPEPPNGSPVSPEPLPASRRPAAYALARTAATAPGGL